MLLTKVVPYIKDVGVSSKYHYIDSSGTEWIEFEVLATPVSVRPGYGIVRKVSGGDWELVAGVGVANIACELPADVQSGLGFAVCQTDAVATASAASGQDVDKAIRDYALGLSAPTIKDVRIDKKTYYTDSSGTVWVAYHLYPLPEEVTDPAYGIMKRQPGGSWVGVAGPGTALIQCGLPEDVQTGLGLRYCPPETQ